LELESTMQKDSLLKAWLAEPALIISAIRAILVAGVGFGLSLSADQITSLVIAMEAVFALFTRQSVYAPATVEKLVDRKRRRAKSKPTVEDVELPPASDAS
jgi:hypothetical protein